MSATLIQIDKLQVVVASSRVDLGIEAAARAVEYLNGAIAARSAARVILASAPSQNETLDALLSSGVDWSRVAIFHMDEYVGLPAEHPATFRAYQRHHVLSRISPAVFH